MAILLSQTAITAVVLGSFTLSLLTILNSASWKKHGLASVWTILCHPVVILKRRLTAWLFLIKASKIIQAGYDNARGAPFEVLDPGSRYVFVSSKKHIKEMEGAPDSQLSLQAAAKHMLQPQYTMANFNWFDKRGTDGIPLHRVLRTFLTNDIPKLLPDLRIAMSETIDRRHAAYQKADGVSHSPLYDMVIEIVSYSNATAFFSLELARDEVFLKAAVQFIMNTVIVAECIRVTPTWMARFIGPFLSQRFKSHEIIYNRLIPVAEQRVQEYKQKLAGHNVPEHRDCIQWLIEIAPKKTPWTAERVVHELMALWFGSVHVLTTTACFAIHDICLRPEYIEPLRKELENGQWESFGSSGQGLPLMDSFLKESARTTPVESISSRRMALEPFVLSDGTRVEVGDWVCTPLRAMLRDATNYAKPDDFHGFRHINPELLEKYTLSNFEIPSPGKPSSFTEASDWQLWGAGRQVCPGRFYAVALMKTMIGLLITKFDCELQKPEQRRWISWRTFIYPLPSTKIVLRPRSAM